MAVNLARAIALLLAVAAAGCATRAPGIGTTFRDCPDCPEMVVIPPGEFLMGFDGGEEGRYEGPVRRVKIGERFAVGVLEVTQEQFARFVTDTGRMMPGGCRIWQDGEWIYPVQADWTNPGYGRVPLADEPVTCVSWTDARDYAAWLARRTGQPYRLLSEAEWEYVARAGSTGDFYWGSDPAAACAAGNVYDRSGERHNGFRWAPFPCDDGHGQASPAGHYPPNLFGVRDILGNVWEWTEDCYVMPYPPRPADGRPVITETCDRRTVRGGSWITRPDRQRASFRGRDPEDARFSFFGLRVARDL